MDGIREGAFDNDANLLAVMIELAVAALERAGDSDFKELEDAAEETLSARLVLESADVDRVDDLEIFADALELALLDSLDDTDELRVKRPLNVDVPAPLGLVDALRLEHDVAEVVSEREPTPEKDGDREIMDV